MSAAPGVDSPQISIDLVANGDPAIGVVYEHHHTGIRLKVGAIGHKAECRACNRTGHVMVGEKRDIRRECSICKGTGQTPGSVVCRRDDKETRRGLKLIWEIDEFREQFRRADGVGTDLELFADDAASIR